MGGNIVTHIAELHPELYSGILACGAALLTVGDPPEEPLPWIFKPKVPLLFVSNYCDGVAKLTEFADKYVRDEEIKGRVKEKRKILVCLSS